MKDERLTFEEVVDTATYFVFFNTQDELFKNANIRRAFSSAINREELADVIFKGVMKPGYGWVSPSIAIGEDEYRGIVEEPVQTLKKENPDAIQQSRRLRIAKGSGNKVEDVTKLLKQFEDMRKVMKQFSNPAAAAKMMRNMPKMPQR